MFEINKRGETNREKKTCIKDYVSFINEMVKEPILHIILNAVLKDLLVKFNQGDYGRIKKNNKKIYKETIKQLYESSNKRYNEWFEKNKRLKFHGKTYCN